MLRPGSLVLALVLPACTSRTLPPPPAVSPRAIADSAFTKPLSFAVLEDYEKGENLEGIANDFRLMHELGIDTWRGSLGWDDYEPERGTYDFNWLHAFAERAAREGIKLRPFIGFTPEWAASGRHGDEALWNDPPAELGDWAAFTGALASAMRRHENVLSYEIYNEQNASVWWDGTAGEYYHVLVRGAAAIRAANPSAQILLGGLVWPDDEFLREICALPGGAASFDVVPFHAYPETWTEDSVTVERYLDAQYFDAFLPAVDSACGGKPVWLNELGYATAGVRTELDQANWWVRAVATFAADRRIQHLGIYEIRDLPYRGAGADDDPNYHLGLVRADGVRKLAFSTVQLLVALLNAGTITVADAELEVKHEARGVGEVHRHLFVRPDGRQVLILWDPRGQPVVSVRLARGGSRATTYDVDGWAAPYSFRGGVLRRIALRRGEPRIFVIDP